MYIGLYGGAKTVWGPPMTIDNVRVGLVRPLHLFLREKKKKKSFFAHT